MTKFLRSRRTKLGLYVAGIIVRQQYGTGVVVLNKSEETLRQVSVKFDSRGNTYSMPDLAANERKRVLVPPVGESSITVPFTDASGRPHVEIAAGYVESGYCENAVATILSGGKAKVTEEISLLFCRRSWLDCITATAATPWSSTRNGGT